LPIFPFTNNGPAITTSSLLQLPNDSPAKQHPVPHNGPAHFKQLSVQMTTTSTGLQVDNDCHSVLNNVTETSIWHQAFDNTLSRCPIMNISNITSVPALNALLTSSYLHPDGGMTAHIDATPTSLLLLHIKDVPVITATIHDPSCLLPLCWDHSAIMMTTRANFLLLSVQDDSAIMMATHTIYSLQLIVESLSAGAKQVAPATIHNNLFKLIVVLASEGAHFAPYIFENAFTYANELNHEGACVQATSFQASKLIVNYFEISFHFCEDCRIFCEGEWQIKDNGYTIVKQRSANTQEWEQHWHSMYTLALLASLTLLATMVKSTLSATAAALALLA
jgi:hypothetical protein